MTFTTITFAVFLLAVFALYWSNQRKTSQNIVLLASSYVFYGWWDYRFCALLLFTSILDYAVGLMLAGANSQSYRRRLLLVSIAANLGVLGVFKYFDFFSDSLRNLVQAFGAEISPFTLKVILPVGISFYTFQSLGYTIDVYRRKIAPVRNLLDFLAFVSFFPQLVAGPIERAGNLLPQIANARRFDAELATDGCKQMLWGVIKKTVVADNLAPLVEVAYADPSRHSGPQLALATVCFAVQIYCDFSGYSDIALGCAKLFAIRLRRNFAYPYLSRNLTEFWHRWHISLSTWFRDYVYIPLGGNRNGRWREGCSLMITFTASGLWHGASWHYLLWGVLNGVGLIVEKHWTAWHPTASPMNPAGVAERGRMSTLASTMATFSFVCVGWVFFRAASTADAMLIMQKLATDSYSAKAWLPLTSMVAQQYSVLVAAVACLGVEWFRRNDIHPLTFSAKQDRLRWTRRGYPALRWAIYTLLVLCVFQFAPFRGREFIYFQF